MNLEEENQPVEEAPQLSPARRRRARRSLILTSDAERAEQLEKLSRKAFPSFGTFFFSLIAGIILGAGYLLDSQTILILGILIVPTLSPWVGLILATVTGSLRYFLQTLIGLAISFGLIFGSGFLAGKISLFTRPFSYYQATLHSHLWWTDIGMVILGSIMMVTSFIRSERRPIIPSVILAYELSLPLSIAGFGLGSGLGTYWPNAILVFCVYFALATFTGLLTLAFVKYLPRRAGGCLMTLIVGLLAIATFTWISGATIIIQEYLPIPWNIPSPPVQEMQISTSQTSTDSPERVNPTAFSSPTATLPMKETPTIQSSSSLIPTITNSPEPTPIYAIVITLNNEGANLRNNPEGSILATLPDGTLLEVLPESQQLNGINWMNVRTVDGLEGWIIQDIISLTTPTPGS